jgi:SH3 domain-containing protein
MDTEQRQHLRDLLRAHQSQLRVLELQAATFGVHAPPHVLTEIDRLTTVIAGIEAQLGQRAPAVSRAALRQFRQQALAAYYAETWERAEDLLVQIVQADPADQDAQAKLDHTQRQLDLRAFYQAICDLRAEGNWRAVLAALADLEQRQPDYLGTAELREWAEAERLRRSRPLFRSPRPNLAEQFDAAPLFEPHPTPLPSQSVIEIPQPRPSVADELVDRSPFSQMSAMALLLSVLAAVAILVVLLRLQHPALTPFEVPARPSASAEQPRPTAPASAPGLVQFRVVNTGGTGLSMRPEPNTNTQPLKTLPEGMIVTIIGDDSVGADRVWKHVRDPDGTEGWVVSDFLQSVP